MDIYNAMFYCNLGKNNEKNNSNDACKNEIKELNVIKDKDLLDKCLRDKLITEKFIEQFIIHTSDVLVLVFGSIILNKQKILERIKKALTPDKYLYVVHNLQNYQNKSEVDDYIENTLKKLSYTIIIIIILPSNKTFFMSLIK